jgi:hypothetical protein
MSDQAPKNPVAPINGNLRGENLRAENLRAIDELDTPPTRLQFGPSHPATHGTVKITLDLEGEKVVWSDVEVGYLHRGFEKECETGYYYQNIPYTDRLNYSSPILNNVGYCMAVEKLFSIVTPPRCDYLRVIAGSCRGSLITCIGASRWSWRRSHRCSISSKAASLARPHDALCGARHDHFVRTVAPRRPAENFRDFACRASIARSSR